MRGWLLCLLVWALGATAVLAETRVALVIGEGAYQHVARLPNPSTDALLVADALKRAQFTTVTLRQDLDQASFRQELQTFAEAASQADVAVVYYAGHGLELGGANYLIPVDAKLSSDRALNFEAVPLDLVLGAVKAKRLTMIVLDACRDNPFAAQMSLGSGAKRSVSRGLTRVDPDTDTLVVYAAKEGTTAADGDGGHSPFATAFANRVTSPGMEVRLMLGYVRDDVISATHNQQQPFTYGSIGKDEFYFVPAVLTGQAPPPPSGAAPVDPRLQENLYWTSSNCASGDLGGCRAYREQYPNGQFIKLADLKLRPSPLAVAGHQSLAQVPVAPVTSPSSLPDARQLAASVGAPVLVRGQSISDFAAFRDCSDCVEMVALPGGSYTMGSPSREAERYDNEDQVSISLSRFAISRFPVTKGEYATFAAATGRSGDGGCWTDRAERGRWVLDPQGSWRDPSFPQTDRDPVVCVNWEDAQAYVRWLSTKTGASYRLLSESEYEYANRAGTTTAYFWGNDADQGCGYANGADIAAKRAYPSSTTLNCDDGYEHTSPVGSFRSNRFGLYDTTGNAWSWTSDCYNEHATSRPRDGGADTTGECKFRVLRGGSWGNLPRDLRSAYRIRDVPADRGSYFGFRLARTLSPP